jgi:hypothetical protein
VVSFDWWDYIRIAEEIFTNTSDNVYLEKDKEAWLRAAISRGYYGVHMLLRKKMLVDGFISQQELDRDKGSVHSFILSRVESPMKETLELLLRYRKQADYEDQFPAIIKASNSVQRCLKDFKINFPNTIFVTF